MKFIIGKTLFSFFCFLFLGNAFADAVKIDGYVEKLQLASIRGDIDDMTEKAKAVSDELGSAKNNDEIVDMCGVKCHAQMARYYLFMASDIFYLISYNELTREGGASFGPAQSLKNIELGLAYVERGMKYILTDNSQNDFNSMLIKNAELGLIKVRLLMMKGDLYYKQISELELSKTADRIKKTLELSSSAPDSDKEREALAAEDYYKQANWTLIELQTDLPKSEDEQFSEIKSQTNFLKFELKKRRDSLSKGYLFLGVEGNRHPTIEFSELEAEFLKIVRDIEKTEDSILGILTNWQIKKSNDAEKMMNAKEAKEMQEKAREERKKDEKRVAKNNKVSLLMHQIGKLEQDAKDAHDELEEKVSLVSRDKENQLLIKQRKSELAFALKERTEIQRFRAQAVEKRKAQDLLALTKEEQKYKQSELRWLISWKMALSNLEIQRESLFAQLKEYDRQISRNNNQIKKVNNSINQNKGQMAINRNNALRLNVKIEALKQQRDRLLELQKQMTEVDICRLETTLAFFGEQVKSSFQCSVPKFPFGQNHYFEAICGENNDGLRFKVLESQHQEILFAKKCLLGEPVDESVDCHGITKSEQDLAREIYVAEVNRITSLSALALASIDRYQKVRQDMKRKADNDIKHLQELQAIAAIKAGVAIANAAAPKITVAAAGVASGVYTKHDISKVGLAAFALAELNLESYFKNYRARFERDKFLETFDTRIFELQNELKRFQEERVLREVALNQTLLKIKGQSVKIDHQLLKDKIDKELQEVDCRREKSDFDHKVITLKLEHEKLILKAELDGETIKSVDFSLKELELELEKNQHELLILEKEDENLKLAVIDSEQDNSSIEDLKKSVEKRIEITDKSIRDGKEKGEASLNISNSLESLFQSQREGIHALAEGELVHVQNLLQGQKAQTEELMSFADDSRSLFEEESGYRKEFFELQKSIKKKVKKKRDEIISIVSEDEGVEEDRPVKDLKAMEEMILASERDLAKYSNGLMGLVDYKRNNLYQANIVLNLMNNRHRSILSLVGKSSTTDRATLATSSQQIKRVGDQVSSGRFLDETEIPVKHVKFNLKSHGLLDQLRETGVIDFEISPKDRSSTLLKNDRALWDVKLNRSSNHRVVDIVIALDPNNEEFSSMDDHAVIIHKGAGTILTSMGSSRSSTVIPFQEFHDPRSSFVSWWEEKSNGGVMNEILNFWKFKRSVRDFDRGVTRPTNDPNFHLPFLGLPLIGKYQINMNFNNVNVSKAFLYVFYTSEQGLMR